MDAKTKLKILLVKQKSKYM